MIIYNSIIFATLMHLVVVIELTTFPVPINVVLNELTHLVYSTICLKPTYILGHN